MVYQVNPKVLQLFLFDLVIGMIVLGILALLSPISDTMLIVYVSMIVIIGLVKAIRLKRLNIVIHDQQVWINNVVVSGCRKNKGVSACYLDMIVYQRSPWYVTGQGALYHAAFSQQDWQRLIGAMCTPSTGSRLV